MAYVTSFEEIATEKGMQAGLQVGRQAGLEAGRQAGEAAALQKLLTKRFGVLPAATLAQITTASPVQLDAWLDRVLDAPSLDVVFGPLHH
jgi:predicted transposase YdaD